jgi:hypothetical protein
MHNSGDISMQGDMHAENKKTDSRANMAAVIVLTVFTCGLLLAFRSSQQTGDALSYLYQAKEKPLALHPHHLLFIPSIRMLWLGISQICERCDVILSAQIHNTAWAVVGVLSLFGIMKHLRGTVLVSVLAALCYLVSRGFWEVSTIATMYVPIVGSTALLSAVLVLKKPQFTIGYVALLSSLVLLCICQHQMNVLICLPVTLYLVLRMGRGGVKVAGSVVALSGIAALVVYIAAYRIWSAADSISGDSISLEGFIKYCLAYVYHPNEVWGTVSNLGRSGIKTLLQNHSWSIAALPLHVIPRQEAVTGVLTLILVGWHLGYFCFQKRLLAIRGYLVVWLFLYLAFFLWWLPSYRHLFVITAFPSILLVLIAIRDVVLFLPVKWSRRIRISLLSLPFLFLLSVNIRVIYRMHHASDPALTVAQDIAELGASRSDVVLCERKAALWLRYEFDFSERHALPVGFAALSLHSNTPLGDEYRIPSDAALWVALEALYPAQKRNGLSGYANPEGWLRFLHWVMASEFGESGVMVSCREFDAVCDRGGRVYLHLLPDRQSSMGVKQLCAMLDAETALVAADETGRFLPWYEKAGCAVMPSVYGD